MGQSIAIEPVDVLARLSHKQFARPYQQQKCCLVWSEDHVYTDTISSTTSVTRRGTSYRGGGGVAGRPQRRAITQNHPVSGLLDPRGHLRKSWSSLATGSRSWSAYQFNHQLMLFCQDAADRWIMTAAESWDIDLGHSSPRPYNMYSICSRHRSWWINVHLTLDWHRSFNCD